MKVFNWSAGVHMPEYMQSVSVCVHDNECLSAYIFANM